MFSGHVFVFYVRPINFLMSEVFQEKLSVETVSLLEWSLLKRPKNQQIFKFRNPCQCNVASQCASIFPHTHIYDTASAKCLSLGCMRRDSESWLQRDLLSFYLWRCFRLPRVQKPVSFPRNNRVNLLSCQAEIVSEHSLHELKSIQFE